MATCSQNQGECPGPSRLPGVPVARRASPGCPRESSGERPGLLASEPPSEGGAPAARPPWDADAEGSGGCNCKALRAAERQIRVTRCFIIPCSEPHPCVGPRNGNSELNSAVSGRGASDPAPGGRTGGKGEGEPAGPHLGSREPRGKESEQ